MVWLPAPSDPVLKLATPFVIGAGACRTPSPVKLTVPGGVGVPTPPLLTVAVKVTVWPTALGLLDEISVVVVDALLICNEIGPEVDPVLLGSGPMNCAVMV